jgi:CRP-like cAMP-binding protein
LLKKDIEMMDMDIPCKSCKIFGLTYFSSISEWDLLYLNQNKTTVLYKKGQTIFHEGNYPTGIYCIQSGKLKIYKDGRDGKPHIVRLAVPGMFIGIRSLLGKAKYAASATALEDSIVCFLNRSLFFKILEKYPKISESLMTSLSQLLLEAEGKILTMAQNSVRQRLAETLLILSNIYCDNSVNNSQPSICMSREDLANIVGTATESVIRIISEFKDENLISTEARKIFIKNPEELERISLT